MDKSQHKDVDLSINLSEKVKSICHYSNCTKRIKLSDYACKCGNIYCKVHKLPENHECKYDYREIGLKDKKIEQLKCVSNKVQKIS